MLFLLFLAKKKAEYSAEYSAEHSAEYSAEHSAEHSRQVIGWIAVAGSFLLSNFLAEHSAEYSAEYEKNIVGLVKTKKKRCTISFIIKLTYLASMKEVANISVLKEYHKLAKLRALKRDMRLREYVTHLILEEERREKRREKEGVKRRRS